MKDFFRGRQAIYEFLFLAFYKVPDERIIEYKQKFTDVFKALANESGEPDLISGANMLDKTDISDLLELNASYTKLFAMGGRSIELKESGWRKNEEKTGLLLSITSFFADDNITRPSGVNLTIDSYSSELYYLFRMSKKLAEATEEQEECIIRRQIEFMTEHFIKWVDNFKNAVLDMSVSSHDQFYAALVSIVSGFIKFDLAKFKEMVETY